MSDDEESFEDVALYGAKKASGDLIVKTLSPAAEEIGQSLAVMAKTVNICLSPLSAVVWSYEEIKTYIEKAVTEKLSGVPPENIVTPTASIAGPVIEAMRFCGETEEIKKIFASLLAAAMNKDTENKVHPAYVQIVQQISVDEAAILKAVSLSDNYPVIAEAIYEIDAYHESMVRITEEFHEFCSELNLIDQDQVDAYLDNLLRLKVIEIIQDTESTLEKPNPHYHMEPELLLKKGANDRMSLTSFGQQFLSCAFTESVS